MADFDWKVINLSGKCSLTKTLAVLQFCLLKAAGFSFGDIEFLDKIEGRKFQRISVKEPDDFYVFL